MEKGLRWGNAGGEKTSFSPSFTPEEKNVGHVFAGGKGRLPRRGGRKTTTSFYADRRKTSGYLLGGGDQAGGAETDLRQRRVLRKTKGCCSRRGRFSAGIARCRPSASLIGIQRVHRRRRTDFTQRVCPTIWGR